MRMRTASALAALLLGVAGCGAGSDEDAKKAIAAELTSSDEQFSLSSSEAECVADGMVDDVGVDQLKEYGILTDDDTVAKNVDEVSMSKDDADATADAFVDCIDVVEELMGQIPTEGMDEGTVTCVEDALSEDVVHDVLAASFAGEDLDAAFPELATTMQECVTG